MTPDSESAVTETFEIERKYDVGAGTTLPDVKAFLALGLTPEPTQEFGLEARYFDTVDLRLGRRGFAVRERRGGPDAGWHLKERRESGVRELQWPPADEMPAALRLEITQRLGGERDDVEIATIAVLKTVRSTTVLRNSQGVPVVELADDRVVARNELCGAQENWREWEAELIGGASVELLDRIEPLLVALGARRVDGTSKIQRTMALGSTEHTP